MTAVAPAGSETAAGTGGRRAPRSMIAKQAAPGENRWVAIIFLAPAVALVAILIFYPVVYSLVRSFLSDVRVGENYTGAAGGFTFGNYTRIFTDHQAFLSLRNNLIWVLVVPAIVTILGMLFAVLSERIRWVTGFKIVLFMPMAISFVATGVAFSLIYSDNPSRGVANAITVEIHDTFSTAASYPNVHAAPSLDVKNVAGAVRTTKAFPVGTPALIPMVGISLTSPPSGLQQAGTSAGTGLHGTIWNDFKLGGGGTAGKIDHGELGLKGITVEAVSPAGNVVGSTTTGADGTFHFGSLTSGSFHIQLPNSDFAAAYDGISWLGPGLITPAIIIAYLWVYAGFAMVLVASGMAAIPRDVLEAARIDGATEWQVFRKVTMPLLAPVLTVVFVTMVINVLKIFDIVYILSAPAPENGRTAQVLATQLYQDYGNSQYGAASAIGIALVVLVLPAMAFNIRRFRRDQR